MIELIYHILRTSKACFMLASEFKDIPIAWEATNEARKTGMLVCIKKIHLI